MKVDSKKIIKGDTFIALKGVNENGYDYILDAIKNGCSKLICEKDKFNLDIKYVKDTRKYLEKYYSKKIKKLLKKVKLIGITGTNGKTTSSFITYQLLNKLNIKCAYIGTVGFYIDKKIKDLKNTTPDIFDLYELFNISVLNNCKVIVMEVSSQAISYRRVSCLKFDIACFTNLTQDHLDFHKTMEEYKNTKIKLFKKLKNKKIAIINSDSDYYKEFINKKNHNILYGSNGQYKIKNIVLNNYESSFILEYKNKNYKINLPFTSKYNIYNYVISLIICNKFNFKIDEIINYNKYLLLPPGRFEQIKYKNNNIIIDYAHTPDGVLNVISSVKEFSKNKIITIIGCGGNRDKTKREKMGIISCENSTKVIFTNDNPRFENEKSIMIDITKNLKYTNYEIIYDRSLAIKKGISLLDSNDVLLILGKGHEEYQIIKDKKIYFSDKYECEKYITD